MFAVAFVRNFVDSIVVLRLPRRHEEDEDEGSVAMTVNVNRMMTFRFAFNNENQTGESLATIESN